MKKDPCYGAMTDDEMLAEYDRLGKAINDRRRENGLPVDEPVRVKVVLLDDEARAKLRQGIFDLIDDYFNGFITFMIWGGLAGYLIGSYYN